jgi:flagellar biosynthetic protein FliR
MGLGGHIIILSLLTQTFYSLPIGIYGDIGALAAGFIEWSSLLYAGSLIIALPILLTLLFVNLCIGVITRAAPALNIVAVGFPAMIVAGLLLIIVSFSNIGYRIQWLWFEALAQVRLLGGLS